MLKGSFFHIDQIIPADEGTGSDTGGAHYRVRVRLNAGHPIFSGHFPGNPVVPGACLIRMVTEVVTEILRQAVFLKEADHVKFLSPVNPLQTDTLDLEIALLARDQGKVDCQVLIKAGEVAVCRYRSLFEHTVG